MVTYDNGTVVNRSARKYATTANDNNVFTYLPVHTYAPDGPWTPTESDILYRDTPNGIAIRCYEEPRNNMQVFEFLKCGVRATLVPYDTERRRNQNQIAGFTVAVNCNHHPVWLSNDKVLGLAPTWQGGSLILDIRQPGLDDSQSLVDRAFRNGAVQNQPDGSPACLVAAGVLNACSDLTRPLAYESCYWILTEPRFIKCVHKNNLDFVDLFIRCVDSWCASGDCDSVRQDIQVCGLVSGIPDLDLFLSGDLCP